MDEIIREKLDGGRTILALHSDWNALLRDDLLRQFASVAPSDRAEYGAGRVPHFSYLPAGAPSRVFVREIHRGGWLSFLHNFHFGHGRLEKEIRATGIARAAGVPVPAILATKTSRIFGPFHRLTVVLEEIPGATPLLQKAGTMPGADRRRIAEEVARHLRTMHDAGVYHVDLTVLNILVDGDGRVHIIDLDKARTSGRPSERLARSVLARFTRSVEKTKLAPSRLERIRFLRAYLGGGSGVPALARACTKGLRFHRLGWFLTGKRGRSLPL